MQSDSSQWQEADLLALIRDQIEESYELDYKASPSLQNTPEKKKELGKDVSAFANSSGGTIIYGIPENGRLPQPLDGGFDPTTITKEWIEHVIHGQIRPRLDVHINPVSLSPPHVGRVAYVLSIPQSLTAHQASDDRYYKRLNFESVPMRDHEIRDVMNRSRHPIVEPVFIFNDNGKGQPSLNLRIVLRNIGAMRTRDIKIMVAIPYGLFSSQYSQWAVGTTRIEEQTYSTFNLQRTD